MKALGVGKCTELCKNRLTNAKTSISLRLNEFLSKNDVNALKRGVIVF